MTGNKTYRDKWKTLSKNFGSHSIPFSPLKNWQIFVKSLLFHICWRNVMSCWGWELSSGQSYLFFGKHQNKRRIWRFWKIFRLFQRRIRRIAKTEKSAKTLKNQNKRERDKNYWDSGSFSQFVTVTNFSMCFRILIKDIMNSSSGQKPFCFFCISMCKRIIESKQSVKFFIMMTKNRLAKKGLLDAWLPICWCWQKFINILIIPPLNWSQFQMNGVA